MWKREQALAHLKKKKSGQIKAEKRAEMTVFRSFGDLGEREIGSWETPAFCFEGPFYAPQEASHRKPNISEWPMACARATFGPM